jgi:hypothetical protein
MGRQRRHHLQAVRLRHVLFPPVEVEDQGARVRLVRYEFRSDFGLLALLLLEANLSVGNSLDVLVEKAELPRNQVEELLDGHLFPLRTVATLLLPGHLVQSIQHFLH